MHPTLTEMEVGADPGERPADNIPQNKAPAFIADVFYVGKLCS